MPTLRFFRETVLPATLENDALYFVAPIETPDTFEIYLVNSTGQVRKIATSDSTEGIALNDTLLITNAKLDLLLAELLQKLETGGEITLNSATIATLKSVTASISNFPTDFPDTNTLSKLEAIRVILANQSSSNGLTDAQLRANPLNIIGQVLADTGLQQPLTQSQLSALTLAVSIASLPLPAGAATESKLEAIRLILANQTVGLTDAQLRATALAITASSLPLPTGAATDAKLDSILSKLLTSPSTEAKQDAILAKIITAPSTEAKQDTANTSLAAIALIDFVKEATLQSVIKEEDSQHVSSDKGFAIFGVRSNADTPTAGNDGDYTLLKLDEEGRLKVASKPASFSDVTGDITAIQATIGNPVAGGTVIANCSRASNVMAFCTGTFSTVNVSFEASLEATGENWFSVQAVRSNANTIETSTGNLSAMPTYAWEMSVNALKRVRVRATARTSGTQSWGFTLGTYATEPIPASQISGTQPISGSVSVSGTATVTPTTPTVSNINSAATTNASFIKASAGTVYSIMASNTNAATRYVKFYNKASAPTVGTDVPVITIAVPTNGTVPVNFGSLGHRFTTGISIAITAGAADSDTAVIGANEVKVLTSYI